MSLLTQLMAAERQRELRSAAERQREFRSAAERPGPAPGWMGRRLRRRSPAAVPVGVAEAGRCPDVRFAARPPRS